MASSQTSSALILFLLLWFPNVFVISSDPDSVTEPRNENQFFILTLSGDFLAVNSGNGDVQWAFREGPTLETSSTDGEALLLPNPRDGSLYSFKDAGGNLQKFPLSIPQMVGASPCRSSDGMLFVGSKLDSWVAVDPATGHRKDSLEVEKNESTCSVIEDAIYIGRTEYVLSMIKEHKRWNVVYSTYSVTPSASDSSSALHLASPSNGKILSLDRKTGAILWDKNFGSPVVGIFKIEGKSLVKMPLLSLGAETLEWLQESLSDAHSSSDVYEDFKTLVKDFYVGDNGKAAFVLPTFSSSQIPLEYVASKPEDEMQLVVAPTREVSIVPSVSTVVPSMSTAVPSVPTDISLDTMSSSILNCQREKQKSKLLIEFENLIQKKSPPMVEMEADIPESPLRSVRSGNEVVMILDPTYVVVIVTCIIFCTCMFLIVSRRSDAKLRAAIEKIIEENSSSSRRSSSFSSSRDRSRNNSHNYDAMKPESEATTTVGKISYDPSTILGRGSQGTFVFKGWFDERPVAVKRILPQNFEYAEREVKLLRESDEHGNVIRYFCTEKDEQFRYMALDLCQGSLHDYVMDPEFDRNGLEPKDVLYQATMGLAHLHSLDIIHRDIKPQNILISRPDAQGNRKALIADFGLCKKLKMGQFSFSARSNVAGTEGWIAQEMMNGVAAEVTTASDVFSMGCVFYFVFSGGQHPFGKSHHRQANILDGSYELTALNMSCEDDVILENALYRMLAFKPARRMSIVTLLFHPVFWKDNFKLKFISDISDRLEKLSFEDALVQRLELGAGQVVRGDWRRHICDPLQKDLRRFRNYRGNSVRDLLRAIRNKKNHYRELPEDVKASLGTVPDAFMQYFSSRFPSLLMHSYITFKGCCSEQVFQPYYADDTEYS